jgi:hypothetical protein
MDSRDIGLAVIAGGIVLALVGLGIFAGAFSWFGRLPGDLRLGGDDVRVYIPITSMLLVSVGLSVALAVLRRFF